LEDTLEFGVDSFEIEGSFFFAVFPGADFLVGVDGDCEKGAF
jgi:hypothetical protein